MASDLPVSMPLRVTRGYATWLRADDSLDHQAPRRDTRDCDVRLHRVGPISEGLTGHDVHHDAPPNRKIEPSRQWSETRVGLDLQLISGKKHAVKAQGCHAGEHRRPRAIFDREAHATALGAQARQIRKPLGEIARYLRTWSRRWEIRGHRERELGAIQVAPGRDQRGFEP